MIEVEEMHLVSDSDLKGLIEDWERMPKRDATSVAKAEGILYAITALGLPAEKMS